MIHFYCGIGEQQWNHHPVNPGGYACISPVYGRTLAGKRINRVTVPSTTQVIQDSGAFSDGPGQRLSFEDALARQIQHAEQFTYTSQITHRASYDLLIDEKWEGNIRYKARWTEEEAELAVKMTVNAARYLDQHRNGVHTILSAQGVSPAQYLKCTRQIIPLLQEGDMFGLGGWCITGLMPARILPVFYETMYEVIPFLGQEGVKHVHIWGVIFPKALGGLLYLCDEWGIALSTDSMGPSIKPCMGTWGYGEWRDNSYKRPPPEIRGLERARHVQATREWLEHFRETKYYQPLDLTWLKKPRQLSLAV